MKLKNYWVCHKGDNVLYDTISAQRKTSIEKMLEGSMQTWKEVKLHGWECIKVDIEFIPVKK